MDSEIYATQGHKTMQNRINQDVRLWVLQTFNFDSTTKAGGTRSTSLMMVAVRVEDVENAPTGRSDVYVRLASIRSRRSYACQMVTLNDRHLDHAA